MATGFDVSTLVDFRDEHSLDLRGKLVWAGDSLKMFQKVPGTVGTVAINYFDVNPCIQYGAFCGGMIASGGTEVLQKDIVVCDLLTSDKWCPNTLQKKWFGDTFKGVAGDNINGWEKKLLDQLTIKILQSQETDAWMNSAHTTCQGLFYQISGSTARTTVSGGTTVTSSNVIAIITAMVNGLPANIQQDDELTMFCSPTVHYAFMQAMFSANNYGIPLIKYNDNGDIIIDFLGPKFTLHKTFGLTGTNHIIFTTLKNLFHAFDGVSDEEKVDLWYERKDDVVYYRAKWRCGVTFWLGDYIVCNF